jgi:microcystin-dependent protein
MSDPYVGEIRMFGGSFAPVNWQFCNGQLMPIAGNETLYTLIGTTYGGDGNSTFGLPDLRGRVPVGQGSGQGLTPRVVGQSFGTETVTLTAPQALHTHVVMAAAQAGSVSAPANNAVLGQITGNVIPLYATQTTALVGLNPASVSASGGSQPHPNIMPTLCVNFIISMQGYFPSQQ